MPDLTFTPEELETLRVALLSAHYNADDEERALRRILDSGTYADEDDRKVTEWGRTQAALRAMRYHLLAERVMAAQGDTPRDPDVDTPKGSEAAPDTPKGPPGHAESHDL